MLRTVKASSYIKVPRPLAFAVLTEFGAYRNWVPDVVESRVLVTEGDVAIAEFLAPSHGGGELVLEFVQSPDAWLTFNQVDRYRRAGLSGRWDLEEADRGSGVVIKASLSAVKGLLDFGGRRRMRRFLERTLDSLSSRSLRLAAHGADKASFEKRKILDVVHGANSLRVEFGGQVYELVRQRHGEAP